MGISHLEFFDTSIGKVTDVLQRPQRCTYCVILDLHKWWWCFRYSLWFQTFSSTSDVCVVVFKPLIDWFKSFNEWCLLPMHQQLCGCFVIAKVITLDYYAQKSLYACCYCGMKLMVCGSNSLLTISLLICFWI